MIFRLSIIFSMIFTWPALAQTVCGATGDPCEIPLGTYRIALPETEMPENGYPAVIFYHGAGGTGARTLANKAVVDTFNAAGFAVIGPDGLKRENPRFGTGWSFHPDRPKQRDELAFTREMIADSAARFDVDTDNIILSGFSIGGSLVWYLACQDPTIARAYAPVAGAFWRPHPVTADCAGPVRMLHTHGWRDTVVPLEGRPLRSSSIIKQGDVFHSLLIARELNGCVGMRAEKFDTEGAFWRRAWPDCAADTALEFALHTGGHAVPKAWAPMVVDWIQGLDNID